MLVIISGEYLIGRVQPNREKKSKVECACFINRPRMGSLSLLLPTIMLALHKATRLDRLSLLHGHGLGQWEQISSHR